MPVKKYDWVELHREFLASKYSEVSAFFSAQYKDVSVRGGQLRSKTRTWNEEKAAIQKAKTENLKEKIKKELGYPTEQLLKIKWNCITILNNRLAKDHNKISVRDLETIIKIISTQ